MTRADNQLMESFEWRLRQLAALSYVLTTACENEAIDGGVDENWLALSIANDLAHECLDDWNAWLRDLAGQGVIAEQIGRVSS